LLAVSTPTPTKPKRRKSLKGRRVKSIKEVFLDDYDGGSTTN